ncbi:MAG: VOC family protein [Proteobacteria bacterium]|nr:VOC family protein [Pseudomonadota bacterium]
MFKKIDHVAIHCSDLDRSLEFYRDAFEFELITRIERPGAGPIAYAQLGGTVLELTEKAGEKYGGYHIAIWADDMDAAIAHLAAKGVKLIREARPTNAKLPTEGDTRRAVYAGPDGEMIEVRG